MKTVIAATLAVVFLGMLGVKWYFDYETERRRAGVECFASILRLTDNAPPNTVPVFRKFCGKVWGEIEPLFEEAVRETKEKEEGKKPSK